MQLVFVNKGCINLFTSDREFHSRQIIHLVFYSLQYKYYKY